MTGEITVSSGKNSSAGNALPSVKDIKLKGSRQNSRDGGGNPQTSLRILV